MANLSNINGKFVVEQTTGYVGIGTTDPNFLIEAAGTNAELALNAASIYRVRSTSNDEFIITKNGVGDRLTIASGGDATFTGNLIINKGNNGISRISTGSADGSDLGGLTLSGAGGTSSGRGGWISLSGNENGGDARIYTGDAANAKLYLIAGGASGSAIQMQTGGSDALTINHNKSITFNDYGSGSFTGTTAYTLAVDSSGNIIETTDGGGDITGSGTANKVAKFTGAKAIGDGPITFATNDSTFAGNVTATGVYTAGNSAIIYEAQRSGGAVAGDWSYDDATTDMSLGTNTNHAFNLKTNNTNRISIDNAGNVGMGISPTEKLDIFKDSGSTYIRVYDNSANSEVGLKLQGDAKTWTLQNWGSGGDNLRILNNAGDIVQLWDDNGNVMIGNANDPEKKLHVLGSTTDATPQVLIQNGSGGDASMTFNVSGQSYVMGIDYDDSSKFKIASSGNLGTNDRVTLLSSGSLGIGTITPNEKLQVAGNIHAYAPGGIDAGLFASTSAGSTTIAIRSNGITHFNGGSVGIGINAPNTKLEVRGGAGTGTHAHATFTATANRGLKISTTSNPHGQNSGTVLYDAQDTEGYSEQHWLIGGSTKMVLSKDGNLGIGVTSPGAVLDIYSPYDVTSNPNSTGIRLRRVAGGSQSYLLGMGVSGVSNDYFVIRDITNGAYRFVLTNGGNVGIGGTSTGSKLEIIGGGYNSIRIGSTQAANTNKLSGISMNNYQGNGTSIFQTFCQSGSNAIYYGSADGGFRGIQNHYFMVNSNSDSTSGHTTAMLINSSGNVGIGTTSLSSKLTIYGGGSTTSTLELRGGAAGNDNATISTQQSMTFQIGSAGASGRSYNFNKGGLGYSQGTNLASINDSGTFTATGDVVAYSDKRLKSDIKTLDGSKVYNMRGVSFVKDNKQSSGVIAQELEKIAPELVNNDSEYKSVAYGNITGYLIEAIKELKAEIEELKKHSCDCKK